MCVKIKHGCGKIAIETDIDMLRLHARYLRIDLTRTKHLFEDGFETRQCFITSKSGFTSIF